MIEKKCFKCGSTKPLSEFYKHKMMADGHLNKCKSCARKDTTENRNKNIEYYRQYDRRRGNNTDRIEARSEYSKTQQGKKAKRTAELVYRERYPLRYKARIAVSNAIRGGALTPEPCEVCGHHNVHAHHCDYTKPLDVMWLCSYHHCEWHRLNEAIPLTILSKRRIKRGDKK